VSSVRIVLFGCFCTTLSFLGCASDPASGAGAGSEAAIDAPAPTAADRVHVSPESDARAIEIAQSVVERMGGWEAWDRTRYLKWRFFGRRLHYWDRHTGDIRIEGPFGGRDNPVEMTILMNVHSREGRAWKEGVELRGDELAEALQTGYEVWINDSYWMVMPYKLLDPGVTLKYAGERAMEDGRAADVLELTFDSVGVTPENRYEVYVARDTGLVEQWSFYEKAEDTEPGFTLPWTGWQRFGEVMLSTSRGRDADWAIEVPGALPESVFTSPDPVGS
jgi:hypothetical protein